MKNLKFACLLLFLSLSTQLYPQGAMLVEDPTAIAQSASQFCEEMTVAAEQKSTLLQQMKQMLQQSQLLKENAEKFKKCMKWVKNARAVIELLDKVKNLKDNYVAFYDQVRKCDFLNKTERNNLIYNANIIVKASAEIYEEAKTIVSEFKEDGDAGLSSYERIQLLERMGAKIDDLNQDLNTLKFYANQKVEERRMVMNLSYGLFNQYSPSACHMDMDNSK